MFGKNSDSKIMGPGYITFNIIRVLNIIALTLVAVASWVMLVMTLKTSKFFFFDGSSHFIMSVVAVFLIVSECSLFKGYYAKNWPNFSPQAQQGSDLSRKPRSCSLAHSHRRWHSFLHYRIRQHHYNIHLLQHQARYHWSYGS
jgi:hypothetical protein